jgi:hypothetical protein
MAFNTPRDRYGVKSDSSTDGQTREFEMPECLPDCSRSPRDVRCSQIISLASLRKLPNIPTKRNCVPLSTPLDSGASIVVNCRNLISYAGAATSHHSYYTSLSAIRSNKSRNAPDIRLACCDPPREDRDQNGRSANRSLALALAGAPRDRDSGGWFSIYKLWNFWHEFNRHGKL